MNTFSIRLEPEVVNALDAYAKQNDRSRNYVIVKFIKEKLYSLTGESGKAIWGIKRRLDFL